MLIEYILYSKRSDKGSVLYEQATAPRCEVASPSQRELIDINAIDATMTVEQTTEPEMMQSRGPKKIPWDKEAGRPERGDLETCFLKILHRYS